MKRKILFALVGLLTCASFSTAAALTAGALYDFSDDAMFVPPGAVSWNFYDFGASVFDEHNNTADIPAPGYPGQPDPFQPNPGTTGLGGERFDIEGNNFAYTQTSFYASLTSTFGTGAYSSVWDYSYQEGALFFGFDGSKTDYAIQDGKLYRTNGSFMAIPDVPGGFGNSPAIANAVGPWRVGDSSSELGDVSYVYTLYEDLEINPIIPSNPTETTGNTWIKEYCFNLSLLGDDADLLQFSKISFTNTLECGNDVLIKNHGIVPEPTTMVLFGLGLLGAGGFIRRRDGK